MARPPVDTRLQKIEKSQQKIEGMLEKFLEKELNSKNPTNDVAPDDEIKSIECQCEKVTVEPEPTQEEKEEEKFQNQTEESQNGDEE